MNSEAVIQLGTKIVEELGLDDSVDTLGRWMAHYIAELILDAETALPEKRSEKMSICASAILDLWKHHSSFQTGKGPFEDIEPIFSVLESLNLEDDSRRYFRQVWRAVDSDNLNEEVKDWLEMASSFDYSARILIRFCLAQATEFSLDQSKEWIRLAKNAGADDDEQFFRIADFFSDENELINENDPNTEAYKEMKERIERLDKFIGEATMLAEQMRECLANSKL
jgi:hypothetical protein